MLHSSEVNPFTGGTFPALADAKKAAAATLEYHSFTAPYAALGNLLLLNLLETQKVLAELEAGDKRYAELAQEHERLEALITSRANDPFKG